MSSHAYGFRFDGKLIWWALDRKIQSLKLTSPSHQRAMNDTLCAFVSCAGGPRHHGHRCQKQNSVAAYPWKYLFLKLQITMKLFRTASLLRLNEVREFYLILYSTRLRPRPGRPRPGPPLPGFFMTYFSEIWKHVNLKFRQNLGTAFKIVLDFDQNIPNGFEFIAFTVKTFFIRFHGYIENY